MSFLFSETLHVVYVVWGGGDLPSHPTGGHGGDGDKRDTDLILDLSSEELWLKSNWLNFLPLIHPYGPYENYSQRKICWRYSLYGKQIEFQDNQGYDSFS